MWTTDYSLNCSKAVYDRYTIYQPTYFTILYTFTEVIIVDSSCLPRLIPADLKTALDFRNVTSDCNVYLHCFEMMFVDNKNLIPGENTTSDNINRAATYSDTPTRKNL